MKIPANQTAAVQVRFTNASGNPAKVQGDVTWESSDEGIATVQAKPDDTTTATITAGPKAGQVAIIATADADLGEGVSDAEAILDVEVVARGEAVGGEITPILPDQGLPGAGGSGGHPDNTLPGSQPGVDNTLPPGGERPDNTLPGGQGGRPDNTLPGGGAQPKRR